MKLRHLSPASSLAAVAIAVLLSGTAVAATLYWFNTRVSIKTGNGMLEASVEDCWAKNGTDYSFKETYKILKPDVITEEEVRQAQLAICEQRAIAALVNEASPDFGEFSPTVVKPNSRNLYHPVYASGTVHAVNTDNTIVIGDVFQQQSPETFERIEQTVRFADDALLLRNGARVSLDTLQPGDKVHFVYQNQPIKGETLDRSSIESMLKVTNLSERSIIRGLGVMTGDYRMIDKLIEAQGGGALQPVSTDPERG